MEKGLAYKITMEILRQYCFILDLRDETPTSMYNDDLKNLAWSLTSINKDLQEWLIAKSWETWNNWDLTTNTVKAKTGLDICIPKVLFLCFFKYLITAYDIKYKQMKARSEI